MADQRNLSVFPSRQPCDHLGLMDYSYYRFIGSLELRGSLNQTDCPISVRKMWFGFSFLRGPISNCTTQNCRLQPAHHTTTHPSQSAILSPCKSLLGRVHNLTSPYALMWRDLYQLFYKTNFQTTVSNLTLI